MLISRFIIVLAGVFINSTLCVRNSYADTSFNQRFNQVEMNEDGGENWLKRQLREFRTYPHLDRAYRLLNSGRLTGADGEVEKVLQVYPGDAQARLLKIIILSQQGRHEEVIRQTEFFLKKQSPPALVYFYMALAYQQLNREEQAIEAYEKAMTLTSSNEDKKNILLALGEIYKRLENWQKAEELFFSAHQFDPDDLYILKTLVQLSCSQQKNDQAIGLMRKVVLKSREDREYLANLLAEYGRMEDALNEYRNCLNEMRSEKDRARIWTKLGYFYQQMNEYDQAVAAFQNAIDIEHSPNLHIALGLVFYEQGQWQDAVMEFHRAKYDVNNPVVQLYIGRCYEKLNNRKMAAYHLEEAAWRYYLLSKEEKLSLFREWGHLCAENRDFHKAVKAWKKYLEIEYDPSIALNLAFAFKSIGDFDSAKKSLLSILAHDPDDIGALNELGYHFAGREEYVKAVQTWQKSLNVKYDPRIALNIGYCQGLMKKYSEAQHTLENIPEEDLSPVEQALLYDSLSAIYDSTFQIDQALAAQSMANALDLSPERRYRAGVYYQKLGHAQNALLKFQEASNAEPENLLYAKELGYAYLRAGDYDKAVEVLARVSDMDPQSFSLAKEVGYLYMKNLQNTEAVKWFSVSLQRLQMVQAESDEERAFISRERRHMQQEIQKINNRFDFTAYQVYRPDNGSGTTASAALGSGGVLRSQGGLELAYQPPEIGFRDERTFQIIGRTLWNNKDGSMSIDEESLQAGAGFRYKPLKLVNFYFGAERLFGIGDETENLWIIRSIYSFNSPVDTDRERSRYQLFYIDGGYFINEENYGAIFAEWREGVRFKVSRGWAFIPHLTISQRWQNPDPHDVTYVEGGGGLILRYQGRGDKKFFGQFEFESLIQYKASIYNTNSGFVLTNVLRF